MASTGFCATCCVDRHHPLTLHLPGDKKWASRCKLINMTICLSTSGSLNWLKPERLVVEASVIIDLYLWEPQTAILSIHRLPFLFALTSDNCNDFIAIFFAFLLAPQVSWEAISCPVGLFVVLRICEFTTFNTFWNNLFTILSKSSKKR